MKITVVGTGYVGLVVGICFSDVGNIVTCVDYDASKVEKLKSGECPIFEPSLEGMMRANIDEKRVFFSTNLESVAKSDAVFLAVGTPPLASGESDLSFLFSACEAIAPHL